MFRYLSAFAIAFSLVAGTAAEATILPKNDLHLYDNKLFAANMTEQEFRRAVDEIVEPWKRIAAAYGARLTSSADWSSSTVNAYAQKTGSNWRVSFFGGLARRPEITLDGFKLVVCHELGHLFGGYFFYSGSRSMSAEGAADYFATQACARYIWSDETDVNAEFRAAAPAPVRTACNRSWSATRDQDLCYRTAAAGASLAALFANGGTPPKVETPDTRQVSATNVNHPAAQCRLDTYFQGGLCTRPANLDLIPGIRFTSNLNGTDSEREANRYSCASVDGFQQGIRPRCWFKPKLARRF